MPPKQQKGPAPAAPQRKASEQKDQKPLDQKPPQVEPSLHLGISRRKTDCFFISTYFVWSFVAFLSFVARCHHLLPKTVNDYEFATPVCDVLQTVEGPLKPLLESQEEWGDLIFTGEADFALILVNYVNLFFVAPMAFLLAVGFLAGSPRVKNIALVHAAVMLYNTVVVDIYAYEALTKLNIMNLETTALGAAVIYGFRTIFPLVVMCRVWDDAPFTKKIVKHGLIYRVAAFWFKTLLLFWMLAAAIGFYEFSVKHTPSMKHMPSVVDSSIEGWAKAAPLREQMMVQVAEFQVYAGRKVLEGAAITKAYAIDAGERILAYAQSFQSNKKAEGGPDTKASEAKTPSAKPKKEKKEAAKRDTPKKEAPPKQQKVSQPPPKAPEEPAVEVPPTPPAPSRAPEEPPVEVPPTPPASPQATDDASNQMAHDNAQPNN